MITIIIHKCAGNESIGSMWHETYLFDESATLKEILDKCDFGEDIIIPSKSRQHKESKS